VAMERRHIVMVKRSVARAWPCYVAIIDTLHVRSAAFKKLWDLHIVDTAPLFEVEIERAGVANACFHGLIVSDPIAAKQFAVFMKSSN
jgi:hypothetical protein